MNNSIRQRPALPRSLYQPSLIWTTALLIYAPGLYIVPALLLYVVATEVDNLALQLALMFPLTILAAYGLNLLGFVGHEGMHLSLTKNRYLSALIGLFYSSSVVTYFEMGFAMQHWNHHRYTNQELDHDMVLVKRYKTWWSRLLFSRWVYNWEYFRRTVLTAMPFIVMGLLYLTNAAYLEPLFTDPLGRRMLWGALIMQTIGYLIIRKMVQLKV